MNDHDPEAWPPEHEALNPVTGLVVFLAQNQADVSPMVSAFGERIQKEIVDSRYEEGIVGVNTPLGLTQLFYAENGRVVPVERYKQTARDAAQLGKQRIEMVRFTTREHLEWIKP